MGSSFPRRFQVADTEDPGALQFARKCSVCHTLTPDDGNPGRADALRRLQAQGGEPAGISLFAGASGCGLHLDRRTISDLFDHGPDVVTPGTKMPIQRLKSVEERDALVRFLKQATAPGAAPAQIKKENGK
ncbi:MAG: cytochrome c [Alphaproteobacteria bacterium]|nr:cytochrome c [Alphaproteobacteria bacterium]